jgi:hypothetical protein
VCANGWRIGNRLNRFRLSPWLNTWLKPGVNEKNS